MSSRGKDITEGLEELRDKYYWELRDEKVKICSSGRYILCPYCLDHRRKEYDIEELIGHSSHVGRESRRATFRDKARHLGLLKYLEMCGETKEKCRSRRRSREPFQCPKCSQSDGEPSLLDDNDTHRIHSAERQTEEYENLTEISKETDQNERAILEQKKAGEKIKKVAEEHPKEMEQLHARIIELETNLNQKQALEFEIERMKGALEVMRHMNEETQNRKNSIEAELKEKEKQIDQRKSLNQALIIKERNTNDEVQEAREQLRVGFKDSRAFICVKRMGELDEKPFIVAAEKKYSEEEAAVKAVELYSLWEDYLRDPNWYPYKTIMDGEYVKEIIDDNDEKLTNLRKELGDEVYNAVAKALNEMNEYNPSGRYPLPELWNSIRERKATLKEGVSYLLNLWRLKKQPSKC